ncbi:F-box/kelch-repeat protein At3g23880-like [Lotus japonicus]|uniref:F-box/kelch-repeat protein At3g23880-like n=1 Tax=Lotus japonicus TaxID=34305 RepID=UPI002583F8BA|nr:F-box/kelch-repeat protein At3g23880-like [Lotus japonicus]
METPPFLCEELLQEILLLLPVKSLVRFKCVSQSWKSIISDSQFIKLHLHRSSSKTKNTDFAHLRLLLNSPSESRLATTVAIPDDYIFSGTCNGLICLCTYLKYGRENFKYLYRFWNPATRVMSQHSPPLRFTSTSSWNYGVGYDCSTDTYKVVVALSHFESGEITVHVYNMGDTCWRTIQDSHLPSMHPKCDAVYVNNTLNWLAIRPYVEDRDRCTILSFDLGKESCAQLPWPYCSQSRYDFYRTKPTLGVLRDCLCIYQAENEIHFAVWQMKEFGVHKSWTRLFNIAGYPYVIKNIMRGHSFAMYMSENGDALLLSKLGWSQLQAVLYTQKDNKLEVTNVANYIFDCYAMNYIESLVPPC